MPIKLENKRVRVTNSIEAAVAIRSLSKPQRSCFDRLCVRQPAMAHPRTIAVLVDRGLAFAIKRTLPGWPPVVVTDYDVPIFAHIAWAEICSSEVGDA